MVMSRVVFLVKGPRGLVGRLGCRGSLRETNTEGLAGEDSVHVSIDEDPNAVPVVEITVPMDAAQFDENESVSFTGAATDAEDGILTDALVWVSSLDGENGTGASFETSLLTVGIHTITASVIDSGGRTGHNWIIITVGSFDFLDFNQLPTEAYSDQDGEGSETVQDSGATLHTEGNRWRRTQQTFTITTDSVLEFDFLCTSEGEVHAIGFDEDNDHRNGNQAFQIFGIQTWSKGIQWSDPYTEADLGTWVHFSIPVGQYYTGSNMHLVFVHDDDRPAPSSDASYRNVVVR